MRRSAREQKVSRSKKNSKFSYEDDEIEVCWEDYEEYFRTPTKEDTKYLFALLDEPSNIEQLIIEIKNMPFKPTRDAIELLNPKLLHPTLEPINEFNVLFEREERDYLGDTEEDASVAMNSEEKKVK